MENTSFHTYNLKRLNNDIQDLSFSELSTLTRVPSVPSLSQYCYKSVGHTTDIYNSDFSDEFSNDNFANSLPSTSTIFHQNVPNCNFVSENQTDELLNSIELNDNDKLLSNNLAMLTHGRQGPCLELVLNTGEVLYAVIDSESDYTSARLSLVQKDTPNGPRQFILLNEAEARNQDDAAYNRVSSDCRPSVPVSFHEPSAYYQSIVTEALSKSDNTPSANDNNFNLCCDFTTEQSHNFSCNIDSYNEIVNERSTEVYDNPLLHTTPSVDHVEKKVSSVQSESKLDKVSSAIDYFPSAVHSIVVSETGKKYPKKYSFYSNISSFLNQDTLEKDNRDGDGEKIFNASKLAKSEDSTSAENRLDIRIESNVASEDCRTKDLFSENSRPPSNAVPENIQNISSPVHSLKSDDNSTLLNTVSQQNIQSISSQVDCLKSHDNSALVTSSFSTFSFNHDENIKNKFLNSHPESAVNNICDRVILSRARASLPEAYLSINRIRSDSSTKKIEYGVFARKTIPSRTLFGPLEGILIKSEEDALLADGNQELQFIVETEEGKLLKLDVSDEDSCNWMKFVRPAFTYKEQNLILSQRGSFLFYTTIDVIHPKQELLVWYSAWYAQRRNYKLLPGDPCAEIPCESIVFENDLRSMTSERNDSLLVPNCEENEIACLEKPSSVDDIEQSDLNCPEQCTVQPDFSTCEETSSASKKAKPSLSASSKKCDKSKNKSLWLCTYCDLTFSNASVMNFHILVHAADDVERKRHSAESVSRNSFTSEEEKFICPQCKQVFPEKRDLISHVSKHGLRVRRWTRNEPIKSTSNDENVNENAKELEVEDRIYHCDLCGRRFKNSITLNNHKWFHSNVLECPVCEMKFEKLTDMRQHIHGHAVNGIFDCPHCQKKYDRYKYLRKHIRSCHSKITFSCKLCKKSFKSPYKLKLHMLRHSDEKDFLCAVCGKLFKRSDKLSDHVKSMHSEEREKLKSKSVENPVKLKKSVKKNVTNKIVRVVTENVNNYFYKCYVCNIGFKRRGMLVNHINSFHPDISLNTIPELNAPIMKAFCDFYCPHCDKVYKSNSKRKQHMLKSHPGAKIPPKREKGIALTDLYAKHTGSLISNPFNCEFCHRQYASRGKLLGHHRRDHRDVLPSSTKNIRNNSKKTDTKVNVHQSTDDPATQTIVKNMVQLQNVEFGIQSEDPTLAPTVIHVTSSPKETACNVKQIINLTHLPNDQLHNSSNQQQCLKIVQSSNGITIVPTEEENSAVLLQQIWTSYPFSSS